MKGFFAKYKLELKIFVLMVWIANAYFAWHKFFALNDGMGLMGGIAFSGMALIYLFDCISLIKQKKESINKERAKE